MGLLRIATVGALGYFAYRALQNRNASSELDQGEDDGSYAPNEAGADAADADQSTHDDDTGAATGAADPSPGAYRAS